MFFVFAIIKNNFKLINLNYFTIKYFIKINKRLIVTIKFIHFYTLLLEIFTTYNFLMYFFNYI